MDKHKVADLAKSFSLSCKQAATDSQWTQKLSSPAVLLIAFTIIEAVGTVTVNGDPKRGWAA